MTSLILAIFVLLSYVVRPEPNAGDFSVDVNVSGGAIQAFQNIVKSLDLFERFIKEASLPIVNRAPKPTLTDLENGFNNLYKDLVLMFRTIDHFPTNKPEWWIASLHHFNRRSLNLISGTLKIKLRPAEQSASKSFLSLKLRQKKKCSVDDFERIQEMSLHLVSLIIDFNWKIMGPYTSGSDKQAYGGLLQSAMDWTKPKPVPLRKYLAFESRKELDETEYLSATEWSIRYDELLSELNTLRNFRCLRCGSTAEEMQKGTTEVHSDNIRRLQDQIKNLQLSLSDEIQVNERRILELQTQDLVLAEQRDEIKELNSSKVLLSESISELMNAKNSEIEKLQHSLKHALQTVEKQKSEIDAKDATLGEYRQMLQDLNDSKSRLGDELSELVTSGDLQVQKCDLAIKETNRLIEENSRLLQQKDKDSSEYLLRIQELTAGKFQSEERTAELLSEREALISKLNESQDNISHLIAQIPKILGVANSKVIDDAANNSLENFKKYEKLPNQTEEDMKMEQPNKDVLSLTEDLRLSSLEDETAPPTATLTLFDEVSSSCENLQLGRFQQKANQCDFEKSSSPEKLPEIVAEAPFEIVQVILDLFSENEPDSNVHSSRITRVDLVPNPDVPRDPGMLEREDNAPSFAHPTLEQRNIQSTERNSSHGSNSDSVHSDQEIADDGLSPINELATGSEDQAVHNDMNLSDNELFKVDYNQDCQSENQGSTPLLQKSCKLNPCHSSPEQDSCSDIISEVVDGNDAALNSVDNEEQPDGNQMESRLDSVMPECPNYSSHGAKQVPHDADDVKQMPNEPQITGPGDLNRTQLISVITVSLISAVILTFIMVSCAAKYHSRKKTAKISV